MPPIGDRTTARKRAAEAHRLRCLGHTWDDIATKLGYGSHASACKAATKHIERMPAEERDIARAYSAGNYRAVVAKLHDLADRCKELGRTTAEVQALDAAASVQERHDKLMGLHIAVASKVDVNVHHNAAELIESTREQLRALAQQQPAIAAPQIPTGPQLTVIDAEVIE